MSPMTTAGQRHEASHLSGLRSTAPVLVVRTARDPFRAWLLHSKGIGPPATESGAIFTIEVIPRPPKHGQTGVTVPCQAVHSGQCS